MNALEINLKIEELERKIRTSLDIEHAQDDIILQVMYSIQYKYDHNFTAPQTPALVLENKLALGKTYIVNDLLAVFLWFVKIISQNVSGLIHY